MGRRTNQPPTMGKTAVLWTVVSAVVVWFSGSARAQESHCGAYVVHESLAKFDPTLGFEQLPGTGLLSSELAPVDGSPTRPEPPCQGPNCSRAPERRPMPTTSSPPSMERWLLGGLPFLPTIQTNEYPTPFVLNLWPDPTTRGLFRPPWAV